MTTTKAFKVVRRTDKDKLISAVVDQPLIVCYKPGEKVSSKWGPILVFETEYNALFFIGPDPSSHYEIWECNAENTAIVDEVIPHLIYKSPDNVKLWWKERWRRRLHGKPAPHGTLAADSVTLTRKIYPARAPRGPSARREAPFLASTLREIPRIEATTPKIDACPIEIDTEP
jgi:hypothetical protein